jgi:iron(III) transport system permease protein
MPLAVPGYVMAYALLSLGGNYGIMARLTGLVVPRLSGYWGALLALSLYTYPYMFLNIRSSLLGLDPGVEESARSLGYSPAQVFGKVVLPLLKPGIAGGALVVCLYVLGDFGAVALMRYEVFSYAIYTQYSGAFNRVYAAVLTVMLLGLAAVPVVLEERFLRRGRYARVGNGAARRAAPLRLGVFAVPAYGSIVLVVATSVVLPMAILGYWMVLSPPLGRLAEIAGAFGASFMAAFPAALLSVLAAVPLVYLVVRYPSPLSRLSERIAYIGYAVPPLALALSFVFFSLRAMPFLYQSLPLLIAAFSLNFLALAMGPIRGALLQYPMRLEEAARSLGFGPLRAFLKAVAPLLQRGILASLMLVFVMAMKELPISFLLAPTGYTTLSVAVFGRTSEALMAEAAPFAAAIVLFSSLFVGLMLRYEGRR